MKRRSRCRLIEVIGSVFHPSGRRCQVGAIASPSFCRVEGETKEATCPNMANVGASRLRPVMKSGSPKGRAYCGQDAAA